MTELTINQLVKIIIGLVVVALVIGGVAFFFSEKVGGFFRQLGGVNSSNLILNLLK